MTDWQLTKENQGRISAAPAQERDQVGHLLEAEGLFESFRHQGLSGGAELVDLGAEEGLLDALGAAELHGGGGLLGEDSREDLAAPGGHGEDDVAGLDFAVGIEDVD